MVKVTHVIGCLDVGGAEMMLRKVLGEAVPGSQAEVISLTGKGPLGREIEHLGVPVRTLGMKPGRPDPTALTRLASWFRAGRPDVVQTWSYHADLVAGLAAWATNVPVVWGLHQSGLDPRLHKRQTVATARVCARLSRSMPAAIVCCAASAADFHRTLGYDGGKMVIIPNGFDLARFRPEPSWRAEVRAELALHPDAELIGLVARFDPTKDHRSFVAAATLVLAFRPAAHLVLVGQGADSGNPQLKSWIDEAGIRTRCHLLGRRSDVARITAAFDLAVSSSISEGLPNTLGEAMSCEVPCVVTDVGDSARLVGSTGWVVPPGQPAALARACVAALELPASRRRQLGKAARQRIREHYSIAATARAYSNLHQEIGIGRRSGQSAGSCRCG